MRNTRKHFARLVVWLLVAGSAGAQAQDDGQTPAAREALLDRTHESISDGVEAVISRIDGLFAGTESHDAPTGSYLRVGSELRLHRSKHGGTDTGAFVRAKIRLPRTSDRLQLIIDQGIESVTRSESQKEAERARGVDTGDEDVFIGLRGIVTESLKVSLTSDVGLRFSGLSPNPYVRGRAQRVFTAGLWNIPLSETLLWREKQGFTAATELAFLRELAPRLVFSANSNATFVDRTNTWGLSEVLSLSRRLDSDALLVYEAGVFGTTRPSTSVTDYTLAVRYRQRFWRDWIIGEVRPQLTFPRSRDYDVVPSLTLRLEAYFGKGQLPVP